MILDTSVIIDVLRGADGVSEWEAELDESGSAAVTPISVMELWEGVHRSTASERERERVETLLTGLTEVPFGRSAAMRAGKLSAELSAAGTPIEVEDLMIAAIAIENGEAVLTGNAAHFERIAGLTVETY